MRAWISLLVGQIEMTLAAAAAAVLGNFSLSFQFSDIASPKAWAFVQWTIITSFRVGQDIRIQIYPGSTKMRDVRADRAGRAY